MVEPNVQKDTPTLEVRQRVERTILQLIVAGTFTGLFDQIASDVPVGYTPYVLAISMILVTFAQNFLESKYPNLTILKK